MTIVENLPDLRPAMVMDFANSRSMHPLLQCTRPSPATCYGADGRRRTVPANVPRLDFDPVTGKCLGLLVEETRTNIALYSETFNGWTRNRSTLTDTTVQTSDPSKLAKRLVENTETSEHSLNYAFTPAANTSYVFSIDVKAAERNFAFISIRNFANQIAGASVSIDLTTLQTNGLVAGADVWVQRLLDGWVRISLLTTTIGTPTGSITPSVGCKDSFSGATTYAGDGVSGIYVAAPQVEVGMFPTSYIATDSAAVTRASDFAVIEIPQGFQPRHGFGMTCEANVVSNLDFYTLMFSDSRNGLGNYIGPRMAVRPYINSVEGGRSAGLASRPGSGAWFRMAASMANGTASGIAINGISATGSAATEVDMAARKFLKFGAITSGATGVQRIARANLYASPLTEAQLRRLTA